MRPGDGMYFSKDGVFLEKLGNDINLIRLVRLVANERHAYIKASVYKIVMDFVCKKYQIPRCLELT